MFDFGAIPPEINSARMFAGPGSGPMLAAASAWDGLAGQLEMFAARYSAVVSELQGSSWSGASSTAMADASAPYVAWLSTTAQQAGQAASQSRAAAFAYEAAFAATVPPVVVAANRALLATLVATNFFGQNTPAIAATETAYAEMWAQDAASMYNYAASASSATTLTQFDQPPETTSSTGQSGHSQAALSQLMSALPQQLQSLASGGSGNTSAAATSTTPIITAVGDFNILTGPLIPAYQFPYSVFQAGVFVTGLMQSGIQTKDLPAMAVPLGGVAATKASVLQGIPEPVLASAGGSGTIGGLSTPPNWASATSPAGSRRGAGDGDRGGLSGTAAVGGKTRDNHSGGYARRCADDQCRQASRRQRRIPDERPPLPNAAARVGRLTGLVDARSTRIYPN